MALSTEATGLTTKRGGQIAQVNQVASPLLRLPAELRNLIYTFTFTKSVIRIHAQRGEESSTNPIGLIHCCRQLRHEAYALFFPTATFDLRNAYEFDYKDITVAIGAQLCAQITSIQVCLYLAELLSRFWIMHPFDLPSSGVMRQRCDNRVALPALKSVHVKGAKLRLSERSSKTRDDLVSLLCFALGKRELDVVFEAELEELFRAASDGEG